LILYTVNNTLKSPVDGSRNANGGVNKVNGAVVITFLWVEDALKLIRGPVSKLVDRKGESILFFKVFLNNASVVLLKDVRSQSELLLGAV
jgi:hypothetical protein